MIKDDINKSKKEMKMEKNKLVVILMASSMLIFLVSLVFAAELNLKITAKLNGFNADFYAVTDNNANTTYDGYDMGSQPLQTNDSRLFSWCSPGPGSPNVGNSTCNLVIDSWPASSRVLYLAYRFNPASSGTLNLTWDSSSFGTNFDAMLTDYGTNSTYSSGANASSPINMETNNFYSTAFSGWRYFMMGVNYFYCGDGNCTLSIGETCSTCPDDCGVCPFCGDGNLNIGEQCDDGINNSQVCTPAYGENCTYCSDTCALINVQGPYCGDTACNSTLGENCSSCSADCGCASGQTCTDGVCKTGGGGGCTETAPTCTPASELACGETESKENCKGECSSTGTKCDSGEKCSNGKCVACTPDCSCASNTCAESTCSDKCSGTCDGTKQPVCPVPSDFACGRQITPTNGCGTCIGIGEQCSINEACINNSCVRGECDTSAQCDDGKPYTNDICNADRACEYPYNTASCDDNDTCTIDDAWERGQCNGKERDDCEYGCDPITGCKPMPTIIPEEIPAEIAALAGQGTAGAGCDVDINQVRCGDFGKCEGQYDVSSLIIGAGGEVKGVQTRKCIDNSGCLPDYAESSECSLKQEVTVKTETWCGEEYTELIDTGGKVVARMKKTVGGESIDVNLNAAGVGYCSYCYDASKDGDEEGIDCGGSCDKCGVSEEAYKGPLYNFAQLATALGFFLFFVSSFIFVFADFVIYIKNIFLLKKLGGKFSYWKKEGYDVDVLEKDLGKMEKTFEYKVHKSKQK